MVDQGQSSRLCSFPFTGLQDAVDEVLSLRAEEVVDIRPYPSYHKNLFSWRIHHEDFQGGSRFVKCGTDCSGVGYVSAPSVITKRVNIRYGCERRDARDLRSLSGGY